jgi:hypothetical protein
LGGITFVVHTERIIMKKVLFLVLALISALAHAAGPSCLPSGFSGIAIGGAGSKVVMVNTTAGFGVVYKCPDSSVVWYATLKTYKGPSVSSLLSEAVTYPSYGEAITAMWGKYDQPATGADWSSLTTKTIAAGRAIK